jgi:transcriptional regulator with XRE-family HTH domain
MPSMIAMNDFGHREFGARVRRWRLDLEPPLTQRELARKIGVSDGFLAHVETGRTLPGVHTLCTLATALGVTEMEMLRAAGYLNATQAAQTEDIITDPELRLFFRDEWPNLTDIERGLLKDFVRMLKTRIRRREQGDAGAATPPRTDD